MVKERLEGLGLMAGINWKDNRDAPENYMGRKKILANKVFANEFSMNFVSRMSKKRADRKASWSKYSCGSSAPAPQRKRWIR